MIRACVDANVLVSYLLHPSTHRAPGRIIAAGIAQIFELVVIETTLEELRRSVHAKPYLRARIDPQSLDRLEAALRMGGTIAPPAVSEIPRITRDPADDYLLAHAILLDIEYLVTGDRDVLVLGEFEGVRIVSPADFADLLDRLD